MNRLIVISSNEKISNEANLINGLFNEGMQLFHLRKKNYSEIELMELLNEIDEKYYDRIVLHQHPPLLEKYHLKGFHFNRNYPFNNIKAEQLKKYNYTTSISSHSVCELGEYEYEVDYQFISPVYDSISKPEYKSKLDLNFITEYLARSPKCKIFALGGICPGKINATLSMGFYGVAVSGYLWNNKNGKQERITIIERFSELKEQFEI